MKIGGHNEFLMVVGPVVAGILILLYVSDAWDMLRQAELLLLDAWSAVASAFRR